MSDTKSIMAGKRGFCAEHKPGHPDAYYERMVNHLQLRIDTLTEENKHLREENKDLQVELSTPVVG